MRNTQKTSIDVAAPAARIRSDFADDPVMVELVRIFVGEIGDRLRMANEAWDCGDAEGLARAAHQLKGAGAGYGFPGLTELAAELEADSRLYLDDPDSVPREKIRSLLTGLIEYASRLSVD